MGRILAIDFGLARVGLAMTDLLKITAQPMDTLNISGDIDILIDKIKELKEVSKVELVVIGYPKHMNGDISETAKKIDEVILKIEELSLHVVKWDERLTTVAAQKLLISHDVSRKKRKQIIDQMAAVQILQGYLDSKK